MDNLQHRIIKIMSSVFEIEPETISISSSSDSIESWDSLRHLNLILALEEEFEITIPDDEVGNLVNLKLIEMIVTECIG